jgi:uncharacterized protein YndB with AHSA1/START domain
MGAVQRIEASRYIAGSPRAVWDAYTDHVAWAEWGGVGRARLEREGVPAPNGVGCIRVFGPPGLAAREEILSFDAPKRMTYRVLGGGLPIRRHFGEVIFEPDGGGTRILWRCRFESKIPGLGPVFRAFIARLFRGALEGLAAARFPEP